MKVKELKPVLGKGEVLIFVDNTVQRFYNLSVDNNEYVFWKDEGINLWDVYGEHEIEQIYPDDEVINIDLK